jgi:hypothetical protein
MPRLTLRAFGYALALLLLFGSLPVLAAASPPVLYSIGASAPRTLAQGAQKSWPIEISEDSALAAVFQGGMWLPTPSGGRVYAKYARHIVHANGIWTWVGTVETVHGAQQVVLTFGKDGVFGMIPQASGYPLRIVTSQGETRVVETSAAAMARSAQALRLHSQRDYAIPPRTVSKSGQNTLMTRAAADAAVRQAAASSGPVTIDVMVAYSQGFENMLGSQRLALLRIQNLVDITNAAYVASGVNQQIRLVYTTEVSYPDNTSNQSALDDITGATENNDPVPIPASLANIASLRAQYGADLVVLLRSYDNSTQGDCGVGWLIGGGQTAITPSDSSKYGYSVVSDGSNSGYYCLDTTFAHELGHNMGDAHDRTHADSSGAYSYSYGYLGNGTNGFSTIMAYGTDTQTPLAVFSNPNISICQNKPCGVADSSSSSADNAHSMNNTAALIAAFEPTMAASAVPRISYIRDDVNGDGNSDLIWRSKDNSRFAYWTMSGTQLANSASMPVSTKYKLLATGDFNGDGRMDAIWTDGTGMWMWVGNGSTFTSTYMRPFPAGWNVVGAADLNADGQTDLIWAASGRIAEWLMDGTAFSATYSQNLSSGWRYLTDGDFDGDGKADLLLTNGTAMQVWASFSSGSFTQNAAHNYPSGWTVLGSADVNGDGKDDLLWRDNPHTRFAYWIMNGAQLADSAAIIVSPQWQFGTAGDFDGSGVAGLIWYNKSSIVMWPGSSTGNYQGVVVHSYPGAWAMLP